MDSRTRRKIAVGLLGVFIGLSCIRMVQAKKPKWVTATLDARWKETPFLMEAAEFLWDESPSRFWGFVEEMAGMEPESLLQKTEKEYYDVIADAASRYLSEGRLRLLKFALSLRYYSPRIEMFRQMAADRGLPAGTGCSSVVDINSELSCDPGDVERTVAEAKLGSSKAEVFEVDHRYLESDASAPVRAVLYAEVGSAGFQAFHGKLKALALEGRVDYVLRPYAPDYEEVDSRRVRLSGYGVELQMKSTEYKAQDDTKVEGDDERDEEDEDKVDEIEGFVFSRLRELYPNKSSAIDKLKAHLVESNQEIAPLKVWQLQDLSLQAAERIKGAPKDEALHMMAHISQSFPLQARSLVRTVVRDELRKEVKKNQKIIQTEVGIQPSDSILVVNGLMYDLDTIDAFSLLDSLKTEHKKMEGLHALGLDQKAVQKMLSLDVGKSGSTSGSKGGSSYALDIRDTAVIYVNDIEKDPAYSKWPSQLLELLRPVFPGMLRSIRRNVFHLVLIVDPTDRSGAELIKMAESFYVHKAPIRIGLVLSVNPDPEVTGTDDAGVAMVLGFNAVASSKGHPAALSFLTDVYAKAGADSVTPEIVHGALKKVLPKEDIDEIMGADSPFDYGRRLASDFISRTGLKILPQALMNGVPLEAKFLNADGFEEGVMVALSGQMSALQQAVYDGSLVDSDNVLDYLMRQPNVMPRLNDRILSEDAEATRYLDLSSVFQLAAADSSESLGSVTRRTVTELPYLTTKSGTLGTKPVTVWVAADVSNRQGRSVVHDAASHVLGDSNMRVGLIFNQENPENSRLVRALMAIMSSQERRVASEAVEALMTDSNCKKFDEGDLEPAQLNIKGFDLLAYTKAFDSIDPDATIDLHRQFSSKALNARPGQVAVVCNGRIIGPLGMKEVFTESDFLLLSRYVSSTSGDAIMEGLLAVSAQKTLKDGKTTLADLVVGATSVLLAHGTPKSRVQLPSLVNEHSVVQISSEIEGQPFLDIVGVVDPLTTGAQLMSTLVSTIMKVLPSKVRIYMNCVEKHSEMPLKNFYRYVLSPEPEFETGSGSLVQPVAKFAHLPTEPILTMGLKVPENWLVAVARSPYDLDNIRLKDVDGGLYGEYELENLLMEGHCFETGSGNPPRGLQFILGTVKRPVLVDTIVMANLGYFQLKANPGAWILNLRDGRSTEIFQISSHDGVEVKPDAGGVKVFISSFRSHVAKIRVQRKPGMESADLLADADAGQGAQAGIWNRITDTISSVPILGEMLLDIGGQLSGIYGVTRSKFSAYWNSLNTATKKEDEDQVINIFSLASGHMYERLLRIMMMSVIKHASVPVKFWFLKNYLSPTLKDFLPHMAAEYGFQYELVEYKWPRWLHQQTEKQRVIWGYKILFLDVLFPLDVKKIIFVDADQVVRADLKELMDLDLEGNPYGYTPFCESRTEMDGYRFWKQGYWKSHLQNRKYHISALYVVDLKKFRRIAAGDRLRGQYQGLSQDPNSLSNLDQDLPNNMIHQVGIKSLPQEWLWCETWCSDESKAKAKTIDLCNNPKTKEAKLTAAMRIIPEWKSYDDEVKALQERVAKGHGARAAKKGSETPKDSIDTATAGANMDVHSEL